jgi:hypothetical protein
MTETPWWITLREAAGIRPELAQWVELKLIAMDRAADAEFSPSQLLPWSLVQRIARSRSRNAEARRMLYDLVCIGLQEVFLTLVDDAGHPRFAVMPKESEQ